MKGIKMVIIRRTWKKDIQYNGQQTKTNNDRPILHRILKSQKQESIFVSVQL